MAVELEVAGHLALLRLNRPEKRNVLDLEASEALAAAVATAQADPAVKALVVAAEGKAFCAGGSLDELIRASDEPELLHQIYAGFLAVAHFPLPTLALVQGAAVGAGMNLALACDIRLVTERARFDTRFMQLGIHSGGGHSWLLQQYLNHEQAVAALLLGRTLNGAEAVEAGLALECVAPQALLERAQALTAGLADVPRPLLEASKDSLRRARAEGASHEAILAREFEVQAQSLRTPEARERLAALQAQIRGG